VRLSCAASHLARAILVLTAVAGLCLPLPRACPAAEYVRYMATEGDEFYYDTQSVTKDPTGKIVYTSLIKFSDANAQVHSRKYRYAVPCAATLQVIRLDCSMNMFLIVSVADFDAQGNLLGQPPLHQGMWKAILQGSPVEKMKGIVCK